MKDPLDHEIHAYDVLDVSPSSTPEMIQEAYTRLAQSRAGHVRERAYAWHRLRQPEMRMAEDFWYYPRTLWPEMSTAPDECVEEADRATQLHAPAPHCCPWPLDTALLEDVPVRFSLLTYYDDSPLTLLAQLEQE